MNEDDPRLLLPWYLSDTLSVAERTRVREHLESSRDARDELDVLLQLRHALQRLAAREPSMSGPARAELLLRFETTVGGARREVEAEHGRVLRSRRAAGERSVAGAVASAGRFVDTELRALLTRPWVPAAVAGVIAAQFVVIATGHYAGRLERDAAIVARSVDGAAVRYRLRFRPDAPAGEIVATLRAHRLRVVAGPDATGAWIVDARGERAGELAATLRRVAAVASVEPVAE